MGKIYFLLIVGVCVAFLLMLILKLERKRKLRLKNKAKRKKRRDRLHQNDARPVYRGTPGQRRSVHGHSTSLPSNVFGAWDARNRRRAGAELGDVASFSANRLYSDDENRRDESTAGTIEYTPDGLPKTSDNRGH